MDVAVAVAVALDVAVFEDGGGGDRVIDAPPLLNSVLGVSNLLIRF